MDWIKEIDEIPSAQVFLEKFPQESEAVIQFFSGEGESLILTKWLVSHGLYFPGLFCLTDYGAFWGVGSRAQQRWGEVGGSFHLTCLSVDNEPTSLFYFGHRFHSWGEGHFRYNPDERAERFAQERGFQDIVMGVRRDDAFRHIQKKADRERYFGVFDTTIRTTGRAPNSTTLRIWFPFYDLTENLKKEALAEMGMYYHRL